MSTLVSKFYQLKTMKIWVNRSIKNSISMIWNDNMIQTDKLKDFEWRKIYFLNTVAFLFHLCERISAVMSANFWPHSLTAAGIRPDLSASLAVITLMSLISFFSFFWNCSLVDNLWGFYFNKRKICIDMANKLIINLLTFWFLFDGSN